MTARIYTKRGDTGQTDLNSTTRLAKDHITIEVLGNIDELNCSIGLVVTNGMPQNIKDILVRIQHELFDLGTDISSSNNKITEIHVTRLEQKIDELDQNLPALKEFIIPGGSLVVASCQMARAICRRAERSLVKLNNEEKLNPIILKYMNRLSDLLFVIARIL